MSSITGLGLRSKVGLGKSSDAPSKPKPQGSSITGLGLRNKAAGLTGKSASSQDAHEYISRPMSTLKDPSLFAPPPKNVNYHGAAAENRQVGRIAQKGPLTPAEYQAREKERLDQEKEEAAIEREERRLEREEKQRLRAEQQANGPVPPAMIDTSGLSTTQFAPPIARRTAEDGSITIRPTAGAQPTAPPRLPPRLPPRVNSPRTELAVGLQASPTQSSSPLTPPNIPSATGTRSPAPQSPAIPPGKPQLNELQSRFAHMQASPTAEVQSQGSSWRAEGAMNISHHGGGEQQAKRWKPVETSNRSYGNADQAQEAESPIQMRDNTGVLLQKKPPPPRPKKKAELSGVSLEAPFT